MGRKEYLESMGVRAARRAFFSYTTEPEGSYSIHRVFIRFLEVNRMDMGQAEKPKAAFPYGLYPAPYLCGEVCPCRICRNLCAALGFVPRF